MVGRTDSTSNETTLSQQVSAMTSSLKEMKQVLTALKEKISATRKKVSSGELDTHQGISLLDVRVHSLLSYVSNLVYFILLKLSGKRISGSNDGESTHGAIKRLIELRIVLEKTKPLEQKLKYQIDKLVKASVMDEDQSKVHSLEQDMLQFKPNLSALSKGEDDDKDTSSGKKDSTQESEENGVYRPPRVAPMPYDDSSTATKSTRLSAKLKDLASKSRLMRDLQAQFDERPEELDAEGTGFGAKEIGASKEDEKWKEREEFEEANFVRLNLTREDKKLRRKLATQGHLLRFQNELTALSEDFQQVSKINKAVESEDKKRFGSGVLAKKTKRSEDIESLGKAKRTKFTSSEDMIQHAARGIRSSGKDKFAKTRAFTKKRS